MTEQWHGGKGSKIRKSSDMKKYEQGWDRIFGRKKIDDKSSEESSKVVGK